MTNVSGGADKLPLASALADWVRAVVTRFTRVNVLRGMNRAEFEQIALDLNLSPPELYGLLTGGQRSAEAVEKSLAAEFAASPQLVKRLHALEQKHLLASSRASLPIGPSCC